MAIKKDEVEIQIRNAVREGKLPIDVMMISDIIQERDSSKEKALRFEANFKAVLQVLYGVSVSGIPFNCEHCQTDGFTLDYTNIALKKCPNCSESGYIKIRTCAPTKNNAGLEAAVSHINLINEWFIGLDDKPTVVHQSLNEVMSYFKSVGLLK